MRIFVDFTGADTAGIGISIKRAFDRHAPNWVVNCMVASTNYIDYPQDVPWSQRRLEELYDAADVVHIHSTTHAHRWYDNRQGKPTVLHHHGIHSREDYAQMVADGRSIGAVQVGSTLDLSVHEPDVAWLPAPVDLSAMRRIRAENYGPTKRVRIGHAPTNRAIKGSGAFDAAMTQLYASGVAEPVLIQGVPWADCLRRKATCDVMFDQPILGYGSNAIEAWAMGIPVVAGVADPTVRAGMLARWGVLPFYEATEATLYAALRSLALDADLRAEYAARGTAHVERWHDEVRTVATLKRIYRMAPRTLPGGALKRLTPDALAKIARHERRARRAAIAVRRGARA